MRVLVGGMWSCKLVPTWWRNFHTRTRWFFRWPLKLGLFAIVVAGVLWPYPWLLPTWVSRLRNMNGLIDPAHPGLAAVETDTRKLLTPTSTAREALAAAQEVVLCRLPYAWDWDTWGVFDYWPTVDEALRQGREDCDGRAVVAASLLQRMGYEATLVTDVLHVWVETPQGATMSPTSTERTLSSDDKGGTRIVITPGLARNVGRGLAYGIAAFPLGREVIILAALVLLTVHPWLSWWRFAVGCVLIAGALVLLRTAGIAAALDDSGQRNLVLVAAGAAAAVIGWLSLATRGRRERPTVAAGPPRSLAMQPE